MCRDTLGVMVYAYNPNTEGTERRTLNHKPVCATQSDAFAIYIYIILRQLIESKKIFAKYMHKNVARASSDSL